MNSRRTCFRALMIGAIAHFAIASGAIADHHGAKGEKAPKAAPKAATPNKAMSKQAPAKYTVKVETTKGEFMIDVVRAWSPLGADRFYELVEQDYYADAAFFRVIPGFMAQIGIHADPKVSRKWKNRRIKDDPPNQSNTRGMISFATSGPNTRTTQIFISFGDNSRLDTMGFTPFGRVRDMTNVDALNGEYGEGAPRGRGPAQRMIEQQGNAYLKRGFPNLDYITKATIVE